MSNQKTAGQMLEKSITQQTASEDVIAKLESLNMFADSLADRIDQRLRPVCLPVTPMENNVEGATRAYPPLLMEINDKITSISNSLRLIETTLDRVEL